MTTMVDVDVRTDEREQQAAQARYRAQMYRALSAAFTVEPSADDLARIAGAAQAAERETCVLECEWELLERLRGYAGADFADLRTRVATEYAELFVGPRAPLAPLYESVYVSAVPRLNTEDTMRVRRAYEREGLTAVKRNAVPNDHLGLELEFMAHLCEREAAVLDGGDGAEAARLQRVELEFLVMHLSAWVDLFAARVAQAWCASYYDAWAGFLQGFVAADDAYLSALAGAPSRTAAAM